MIVNVTPLISKGLKRQRWMLAMGQVRGDLVIRNGKDTLMDGRQTRVAELLDTDDPYKRQWRLFDVQLTRMKGGCFELSGIQRDIAWSGVATGYEQTWRCHLVVPGEQPSVTAPIFDEPEETGAVPSTTSDTAENQP